MVEPIAVDGEALATVEEFNIKHSALFARDYLGLKPASQAILEQGPDYYPAPDSIDEKIKTLYLSVNEKKGEITPKSHLGHSDKFQARGVVREFDAQKVLDAITVGMIPNARLELQILSLFQQLKIKAENWSQKRLSLHKNKITSDMKTAQLLKLLRESDSRFKDIKGTAGQLRAVHSVFVEEGNTRGSMSGLTSQDVDFIVRDDQTVNTVIVLPISKSMKDDVYAGFLLNHLPVPQRHEGNGLTIDAPSFNLPPEVKTQQEIKRFIADKFHVLPHMVTKMGESYYSHVGMTPQRIHPYAVAAPPAWYKDPNTHCMPMWQLGMMYKSIKKSPHFLTLIGRSIKYFSQDIRIEHKLQAKAIVKERFEGAQPDWGIPLTYENVDIAMPKKAPAPDIAAEALPKAAPAKKTEQKPKAFHSLENETLDAKQDAKAETKEELNLHKENAPDLHASFEAEFEEFIKVLEKETETSPKPEKW